MEREGEEVLGILLTKSIGGTEAKTKIKLIIILNNNSATANMFTRFFLDKIVCFSSYLFVVLFL